MHLSIFLFISNSQNRNTIQPFFLSSLLCFSSLLIFFSILFFQNFCFNLAFNFAYSFPCQKSPSQKIAILYLVKAKSGLPSIFGLIRYPLILFSQSAFRNFSSILVPFDLIEDITLLRFSLDNTSTILL